MENSQPSETKEKNNLPAGLLEDLQEWWNDHFDRPFSEVASALPTQLNEFGYDPFGFQPQVVKYALYVTSWLYKYYFRVELQGAANIPEGRVMMISNHSGQLPIDGVMIATGVLLEGNPPRAVRSMVERWAQVLPFVNVFFNRVGQILGTPENARALLEMDEALLVFPEGTRGINKLWWDRYKLQDFGLGFMRLALETRSPIVPIAVVGAEEQIPTFYNLKKIAGLLKMPALPVTPFHPWLPGLGMMPLPTKYRIWIGQPMEFDGDPEDEDSVIQRKVNAVKQQIQEMLTYGVKTRKSVFF